jgi:ABC-2 type transport system permease protein
MNKTLLIIKREFLSRVQKKTFLLTTILLPLLIFGFYALIIYFSVKGEDNLRIAIADQTATLRDKLESNKELQFSFVTETDPGLLQKAVNDNVYSGYIIIPAGFAAGKSDSLVYWSNTSAGLMTIEKIERRINKAFEKNKLQHLLAPGVSLQQVDSTNSDITIKASKSGGKTGHTGFAYALGFICGIFIYMVLLIYGTMVMRGVMEEKMNRIAEVMVSSVKPFQMMLGKIFGIGAVGLVQFMIWGILIIALQLTLPLIFPQLMEQATQHSANVPMGANSQQMGFMKEIMNNMNNVNMGLILFLFIIYFLGGYLLYASLFAAVGSSVNEDPQDAQQLTLPIIMPIIFSFVIMTQAVNKPDGGMALFGSLFPLSSPIVMMARLPYGVPGWQIALSLLLLILGFLATAWLAARIYRTGILMYGKKVTWKELWKWGVRG